MLDLTPWVPSCIALLTLVGGLGAYGYQKRVDRRFALGELRRTAYQDLLLSLQRHLHGASANTLNELSAARAKAFVVASDPVVKAMGEFFLLAVKNQSMSAPDGKSVMDAYAAMILAMRQDSFERSRLSKAEIVAAAPVVWGETP